MFVRIFVFLSMLFLSVSESEALKISADVSNVTQRFEKASFPASLDGKVLKVAICEEAPFAFLKKESGSYEGISIDVWEFIARKNALSFKYIPVTREEGIRGVSEGRYDLLLGGIPDFVQEEGILVEYTVPFYVSGLGIAVSGEDTFKIILSYLTSWDFFKIIFFLIVFLGVQAVTVWVFERKKNPSYKRSLWGGLGNGFWWSAGLTSGLGVDSVISTGAKSVSIVWMFVAVVIVNIFTGIVSSELTVGKLGLHVQSINDLERLDVICLNETVSKQFLENHFISCKSVNSLEEGFNLLKHNKSQALIYDEPTLKYMMNKSHFQNIKFIPAGLVNQYYSFMVPRGSAILYFLNQEILELLGMEEIRMILVKYFGNTSDMRG